MACKLFQVWFYMQMLIDSQLVISINKNTLKYMNLKKIYIYM